MPLSFEHFTGEDLEDRDNPIFSIALTPDARLAVAGPARSSLSVWDSQSGEMLDSSYDSISAIAVAVTPDQKRLVCRGRQSGDHAWSMQVGDVKMAIGKPFLRLMTLQRDLAPLMGLGLSPDGRLAAWGEGSTVHIRDIETGEVLRTLHGCSGEIQSVRFSSDGCLVAFAGSEGVEVGTLILGACTWNTATRLNHTHSV